jgi:hypothetical protein
VAERYSLRVIWDDLALPDLACSFKLAIGPNKMLLAFCGVLAICTLGYLMDRCTNSVVAVSQNQTLSSTALQTELDIYIDRDSKDVNAFIKGNKARSNTENQGVFSTLWVFASGRFHNAATQLLDLSKANFYANVKNALDNVWLCVRAVGWAFRFHPIYSAIYFSISFLIFVFIGGAISRCAALEFAKSERPGLFEAAGYATQNYRSFLTAPLLPLGLVGVFAFVVILLGMVAAIPYAGELLMVLLFGFVLFFGFLVTLMVLGTVSGGLLLFPSIAYEKTTGPDSIGRAFNYVLHCPTWMFYYVLTSGILGTFFYLVLRLLMFLAIRLTYSLLLAGMVIVKQSEKLERIWPEPKLLSFLTIPSASTGWSESIASGVIYLFMLGIVGILLSYIVSYFFSSATVIYALMRKKVDKIEAEQIFVHLERVAETN